MTCTSKQLFVIPILLLLILSPSWADEVPLTYDRVTLSASARSEVANDIVVAILYSQREGNDARLLADEVNREIRKAVDRAKQIPNVTVRTLDYQTNPVYQNQRLVGWRISQSIHLQSSDLEQISDLTGELQEDLALRSIAHSISDEKRKEAEDQLIAEAIQSFKRRAELISKQLDGAGYRLVQMNVVTGRGSAPVAYARAMSIETGIAPPAVEPGSQTVEVSTSGIIELKVR